MKQPITAPSGRAVTVTVYEPAQRADQEEVVIETFKLEAGETREYDFQSATAAYRFDTGRRATAEQDDTPMRDKLEKKVETMKREDEERLQGLNRGAFQEKIADEMEAGAHATEVNQKAMGGSDEGGEGSSRKSRKKAQHSEEQKSGEQKSGE